MGDNIIIYIIFVILVIVAIILLSLRERRNNEEFHLIMAQLLDLGNCNGELNDNIKDHLSHVDKKNKK